MNSGFSISGFTLIEVVVVTAILGILVAIAQPRLYMFIAKSRQSEAKQNLGVINTLQEAYLIAHSTYYDPDTVIGNSYAPFGWGQKYGYQSGGGYNCGSSYRENPLGFVLPDCEEVRYGYVTKATAGDYFAFAHAYSDENNWLYPRCSGSTYATTLTCSSPSKSAAKVIVPGGHQRGDAWCTDPSRQLQNYIDIIENCVGQ